MYREVGHALMRYQGDIGTTTPRRAILPAPSNRRQDVSCKKHTTRMHRAESGPVNSDMCPVGCSMTMTVVGAARLVACLVPLCWQSICVCLRHGWPSCLSPPSCWNSGCFCHPTPACTHALPPWPSSPVAPLRGKPTYNPWSLVVELIASVKEHAVPCSAHWHRT